ncbi:MAG: amidohydrolase family protein [Proteobacteria bacterium]|nr:amidohydrolase family protein [Pseudomonadota bacterium]
MDSYRCVGAHAGRALTPGLIGGGGPARFNVVVDIHCHVLTPEVDLLVKDRPERSAEGIAVSESLSDQSVGYNVQMMQSLLPKLTNVSARLADMDRMGIDIQALSPSPTQYYYWADQDLAGKIVSLQNDRIADMCAAAPDRFVGLGAVSLQFPELAANQLEHCVRALGFRGVEISSNVSGRDLSDPSFAPFWRKVEELDVVVFLHPLASMLARRGREHYLANIIGVPLETTLALSHLIFGGVLDRHPGLKICAAHGGGFLPSYCGRSDHAWAVRPECRQPLERPSHYLKQLYFDTVVFQPSALEHLVRTVGAEQLLMGTDYPFDMGVEDPLGLVSAACLTEEEAYCIAGGNAASLLRIATGRRLATPPG